MIKETAQLMLIAITFAFGSDFRVPADGTGPVLMYTPNQHCMPHVDGGGTVPLCTPDQHCVPQVDGTNPVPLCTPDQHCPGQPLAERELEDLQRYRELVEASLKLGFYARAGLARTKFWMLVRTHPWCPLPPPRLARLKQTKEFDFVSGYSRYKEAVCDYGLIYGREFQEVLMELL